MPADTPAAPDTADTLARAVAALADEWEAQGREAEAYMNRAHASEISEVMAEARWFPARAAELREVLAAHAARPPADEAKVCKYGDPTCPCQDGDQCHYEGDNPMSPPADEGATLTEALSAPDCPNHREVQHRDGKPPWCNTCGWNRGRPAIPPALLSNRARLGGES